MAQAPVYVGPGRQREWMHMDESTGGDEQKIKKLLTEAAPPGMGLRKWTSHSFRRGMCKYMKEYYRDEGFTDEREVVNGHFRWCGEDDTEMQARYHDSWDLMKRLRATLKA